MGWANGSNLGILLGSNALLLVILILASTDLPKRIALYLEKNTFVRVVLKNAAIVAVFLLAVVYLVNGAYNPFLYFRF